MRLIILMESIFLINKMKQEKIKIKKCKHIIEFKDPCVKCGHDEGDYIKCGEWVCINENGEYEIC